MSLSGSASLGLTAVNVAHREMKSAVGEGEAVVMRHLDQPVHQDGSHALRKVLLPLHVLRRRHALYLWDSDGREHAASGQDHPLPWAPAAAPLPIFLAGAGIPSRVTARLSLRQRGVNEGGGVGIEGESE